MEYLTPPTIPAGIADAFESLLGSTSQVEIARRLGVTQSGISKRDNELGRYSAVEFVKLAMTDADLCAAIVCALTGRKPDPHPLQVRTDLVGEIAADAAVTASIAGALADGKVTVAECRSVKAEILKRQKYERETLLPDLDAAIESVSR
jgi:hypothetical protein